MGASLYFILFCCLSFLTTRSAGGCLFFPRVYKKETGRCCCSSDRKLNSTAFTALRLHARRLYISILRACWMEPQWCHQLISWRSVEDAPSLEDSFITTTPHPDAAFLFVFLSRRRSINHKTSITSCLQRLQVNDWEDRLVYSFVCLVINQETRWQSSPINFHACVPVTSGFGDRCVRLQPVWSRSVFFFFSRRTGSVHLFRCQSCCQNIF